MLDTYPHTVKSGSTVLAATIDVLTECAQTCTVDSHADLSGRNITEMATCTRLSMDCADVCAATIAVTSRQADYGANVAKPLLQASAPRCDNCGDECE